MNKHRYRTVFSKHLGVLVAVGEHTKSHGRSNGQGKGGGPKVGAPMILGIKAGALAVLLAMAAVHASPAFAVPSITYSGNLTNVPPPGVTDWEWRVGAASATLTVGNRGAGTLDIRDGATASGFSLIVGSSNGVSAPAVLTVDGNGSTVASYSGMNIGLGNGNGTLKISNGGQVDVAGDGSNIWGIDRISDAIIGSDQGSTGHAIVTGKGSSLTANPWLGASGSGDLAVLNGGQVTGDHFYLGSQRTGKGTAIISGEGSAWNGQSGVWVGQAGSGELNLIDGGSINDSSLQIADAQRSVGVVNVGGKAGEAAAAAGNLNVGEIVFNGNGGGSDGTLNFNTNDGLTVAATIRSGSAGAGTINQIAGTTILTGDDSAFSGITNVNGGYLLLGNGAALGGTLNVASKGTFGGDGVVKGTTSFGNGATLYGQSGQQLTFENSLTLPGNNQVDVMLSGGPSDHALFNVQGDLGLGTSQLNIVDGSAMDVGVYRIFDYSGGLTGTMTIGSVSEGDPSDYQVQTQQQGQVNLVSTFGRQFYFWDGGTLTGDGIIHGGDGTWDGAATNWTGVDGQTNSNWGGNGFAVFSNGGNPTTKGGIVTIANGFTPSVNGMQFMTDGYVLQGGALTLGGKDDPLIIVGDGEADDATKTATIKSVIQGTNGLVKSGLGNLVLGGANTYTGSTKVEQGTLTLGEGGSIDGSSNIELAATDYGRGTLAIDKTTDFTLSNQISGVGEVFQRGTGTTVFAGDNSFTGGLTVEHGTAKAGIADHAFGAGTLTVEQDGTADLANLNQTVGGLEGTGHVALGSGTLTPNQNDDTTFSGAMDGTGGLTKSGTGNLTLDGTSNYSGNTVVSSGSLVQGAAGAFSSASNYSVASGALVDLGGYSTSMAGLSNSGTVNFGGSGGTVLNVAGNYAGNGGTLVLNTVLDSDGSKIDMLKVGGDTSGTTNVKVVNRGGLGAQTVSGIEVVDVGGQSNGTFSLIGDYVTKDGKQAVAAGAYAYTLQQGSGTGNDDGNWYLTSQLDKPGPGLDRRYSPSVPIYEGYVATLQALNKPPTLQERVGERYWTGKNGDGQNSGAIADDKGMWARVQGGLNHFQSSTSTASLMQDVNTFTMQAGVDHKFYEDDNGKLIGGVTGQYGNGRSDISSFSGDGAINTNAWGVGATATWYGNTGFYVDGQAQVTWFDSNLKSWAAHTDLANGRKATGYATSLEAGKRVALDQNWSVTPQAQLMWSSIDANAFQDTLGSNVNVRGGNSLIGRLGVAVNYTNSWKGSDGLPVSTSFYGIANVYQEMLGGSSVNVAGVNFDTSTDRTWIGVGAGGAYSWADKKYTIYGETSVNTSLNHFASNYSVKANVGFRMKW